MPATAKVKKNETTQQGQETGKAEGVVKSEIEQMADLFVEKMGDELYANATFDKSIHRQYPKFFREGLKVGFMQAIKFQRMKEQKK